MISFHECDEGVRQNYSSFQIFDNLSPTTNLIHSTNSTVDYSLETQFLCAAIDLVSKNRLVFQYPYLSICLPPTGIRVLLHYDDNYNANFIEDELMDEHDRLLFSYSQLVWEFREKCENELTPQVNEVFLKKFEYDEFEGLENILGSKLWHELIVLLGLIPRLLHTELKNADFLSKIQYQVEPSQNVVTEHIYFPTFGRMEHLHALFSRIIGTDDFVLRSNHRSLLPLKGELDLEAYKILFHEIVIVSRFEDLL
jgi:hypothetical protein